MQISEKSIREYASVTEVTGYRVTQEQIDRMLSRYRFAQEHCLGKNVLEVACGSGQGLGLLAEKASKVTGIDIDNGLVDIARRTYGNRPNVEVLFGDAEHLPFPDSIFDVLLLYEAIYYLPSPDKFLRKALRVLKNGGTLIICSANKSLKDFNPSPFSYSYFSADELSGLLENNGYSNVQIYGQTPVDRESSLSAFLSCLKRLAVKMNLMPRTMAGKEILKRLFYGKLHELPPEITDAMGAYSRPQLITANRSNADYKVLFALCQASK